MHGIGLQLAHPDTSVLERISVDVHPLRQAPVGLNPAHLERKSWTLPDSLPLLTPAGFNPA